MRDTKALVESSLLVALSVVLFLASHFLPVVGVLLSLFCPVPLVILGLKVPLKNAFMGTFVAFVLVTLFMGVLGGVLFVFGFALMGVMLGFFGHRFDKVSEILFYGFLVSLFSKLILMALVKLITGVNPFAIDPKAIMEAFNEAEALFSGSSKAFFETMRMQVEAMSKVMVYILPAILIAASFLDCVISYLISQKVAGRFKITSLPKVPPFGEWRFPKSTLFAFFIAFILSFFDHSGNNIGVLYMLALNLKVISIMIFMVQGMATVWYILSKVSKQKIKPWVGVVVVAAVMFIPVLSVAVIMLGFADILIDLRAKIGR